MREETGMTGVGRQGGLFEVEVDLQRVNSTFVKLKEVSNDEMWGECYLKCILDRTVPMCADGCPLRSTPSCTHAPIDILSYPRSKVPMCPKVNPMSVRT